MLCVLGTWFLGVVFPFESAHMRTCCSVCLVFLELSIGRKLASFPDHVFYDFIFLKFTHVDI